jgi:hypothetical protein
LLACNEAQDVTPGRWDAVFDPMGAAHHATQVFSGTVWTSRTLLARQGVWFGLIVAQRKDHYAAKGRRQFVGLFEDVLGNEIRSHHNIAQGPGRTTVQPENGVKNGKSKSIPSERERLASTA